MTSIPTDLLQVAGAHATVPPASLTTDVVAASLAGTNAMASTNAGATFVPLSAASAEELMAQNVNVGDMGFAAAHVAALGAMDDQNTGVEDDSGVDMGVDGLKSTKHKKNGKMHDSDGTDGASDGTSATTPAATGASSSSGTTGIKRKSISLSRKKEAIEWISGPGKGIPSRAEKHFSDLNWDVSASSFRKWWKNRDKIMSDSSSKKRIAGGGRKPYLGDNEERLLVAVIAEKAKKDRVTRKWIAKTAQQMFQHSNSSFKASENWVTKFIRRNGLTLRRSYVTFTQPNALLAQALGTDQVGGGNLGGVGVGVGVGSTSAVTGEVHLAPNLADNVSISSSETGTKEHVV